MKKLFRYPISDIYMVLGLLITFLSLFFTRTISDSFQAAADDGDKYQYEYSESINVTFDSVADLTELFDVTSGVYEIGDVSVVLNDKETTQLCTVILGCAEETVYQICEGSFPTEEELNGEENVVLLGRGLEDICYERDGYTYVMAQNDEYRVTGFIGTDNSDAQDYEVVFFLSACGDGVKQILEGYETVMVMMGSNSKNTAELYDLVAANIEERNLSCSLLMGGDEEKTYSGESTKDNSLYQMLYLFCMINCLVVSEFWISERKSDVSIRRILGYSGARIYGFLYAQLLKPVCVAAVLCLIAQFFSRYLSFEGVSLTMRLTMGNVLWMLAAMLISAAVIAGVSMYQAMKTNPVDTIRNKE